MTVNFDGLTMNQVAERNAELHTQIADLQRKVEALAVENAALNHAMSVTLEHVSVMDTGQAGVAAMIINDALHNSETPATDAALAEIGAKAVEACAEALLSTDDISCEHEYPMIREFAAKLRKESDNEQ